MRARAITTDVSWLGAVDWSRRLFDALIPLPQGTSYNAYLVRGEKTALIDTVDPSTWEVLRDQLEAVPELDYVVIQHMEQDHSGSLPFVLERYPRATVVTNPRCQGMLVDHLQLPADRFQTVADGETLDLGGKTLRFIYTPWVHLPETMCTYLEEDRLLFSCDLFGAHLATSDLDADEATVHAPAKRYYAEIMMPFAAHVVKNLERLAPLDLQAICPSHGPIHRRPAMIIAAYREWAAGPPRNLVTLAYVTMHGSTLRLVERLEAALVERGVAVDRFDLSVTDLGELAISLVDAATLVLGTPTIHNGPHPSVVHAAFLVNALKPKARHAAILGSYGWSARAPLKLADHLGGLKLELLEPVLSQGLPRPDDLARLDGLAGTIAERHQGLAARAGAG